MSQVEALAAIRSLAHPFFETRDLAALLDIDTHHANMVAARLAKTGFILRLARGRWAVADQVSKFAVPQHLTAPYPAYISLQSALYHYGMVSQIPTVTYAVSLARSRRYQTAVGVISIHHVAAYFFFGFEADRLGSTFIARPEKALLDVLYLSPARSRLFASLPEIEVPTNFSWSLAQRMAQRIVAAGRRTLVISKLNALRKSRSSTRPSGGRKRPSSK